MDTFLVWPLHCSCTLLHVLQGRQKYQLKASYLELYDEQITDLLAAKSLGQLTVREDVCRESARVYVDGLTEVELLNGERISVARQFTSVPSPQCMRRACPTQIMHKSCSLATPVAVT